MKTSSSRPYLLLASFEESKSLAVLPGVRKVGEYRYLSSKIFTLRGLLARSSPDRIVLLANFSR